MVVNAIGRHDMATLAPYKGHRWIIFTEGQYRSFDDFVVVDLNNLLNKRSSGGDLRRHDHNVCTKHNRIKTSSYVLTSH